VNAHTPQERRPGLAALVTAIRRVRMRATVPRLHGGLALARDKPGLDRPIVDVPLPRTLVLPLVGYRGRALAPQVAVGQRVARGESLAAGLPASAAGTVVAIEPRPIAHPAGRDAPCIVLASDVTADPTDTLRPTLPALDALTLGRLVACGVGGLGGAGFPTPDKLTDAAEGAVHTLVVNGAECEPGIACDEALMAVAADDIVAGALALARLAGARRCLFVVESDKREARAALRAAIDAALDTASDTGPDLPDGRSGSGTSDAIALRLIDVAPLYPSGAERLLLRLATGIDVPAGERPTRHGLLCVNVATARAAHRARLGEPSLTRIVTIAGSRVTNPCNARVAFGTPLADVLDATGQGARDPDTRRRVGGPLSGHDVASECVPVTATVNRIALERPHRSRVAVPCIRCAACSDVCPVGLLPQELLRHAHAGDGAALDRGGLDACLECGCCDIVCPSSIELTASFRHARGERSDARLREREATRAEALHRRREARLAGPGDTRSLSPAPLPATDSTSVAASAIATAVTTRVPAPDARHDGGTDTAPPGADRGAEAAAAALARARRRRRRKSGETGAP